MKPLIVLTRIMTVGLIWSVFFIESIRVIMLKNWHFDIFQSAHWHHAWTLWLSGWVINTPKEWAFVLIILTFIPLWLSGWAGLSLIKWERLLARIMRWPLEMLRQFFFRPVKIIAKSTTSGPVKKKKSYKEVRPRSLRLPLDDRPEPVNQSKLISANSRTVPLTPAVAAAETPSPSAMAAASTLKPQAEPKSFEHSLFKIDSSEDEDFDFNFDEFDLEKDSLETKKAAPEPEPKRSLTAGNRAPAPAARKENNSREAVKGKKNGNTPKNNNQPRANSGNSILDVIRQHKYETINGATIRNTLIDFIGVAKNQIILCLIDREPGDWLADEERFNDEEPLWFSESSHRISPVRKVDIARKVLEEKIAEAGLNFTIKPYVIISIGNIINAEDMFEIWDGLGVNVVRIDRGTPKEIKLFAKALDDAEAPISRDDFEKVKKLIRNNA